jgi:hypothetical protein
MAATNLFSGLNPLTVQRKMSLSFRRISNFGKFGLENFLSIFKYHVLLDV